MKLHEYREDFLDLAAITADNVGIPVEAVIRDYYLVMLLQRLEQSEFADVCVFKGGTSLSKCYPSSIKRFSEDVDLTYLPTEGASDQQIEKKIKKIEKIMSEGFDSEFEAGWRRKRAKASNVFFTLGDNQYKIKLEIGSSVRPDPYEKKTLKAYVHEQLEQMNMPERIQQYELAPVTLLTLSIERTFLDKIMAVKRHAYSGELATHARHIYDVTTLMNMPEIKAFLSNTDELKPLLRTTKVTDHYYIEKRDIKMPPEYDPTGPYGFSNWEKYLDSNVKKVYESLHQDLLYTDEKQDFARAIDTFKTIDSIFASIDE